MTKSYDQNIRIVLFVALLISALAFLRFRSGEINYLNSDATWHVLYTLKCYDETPISVHKFLPLISFGGTGDKWISWGACIPDKLGNYYYTSFSPAGYFLPYIFFKLLRLDFTETSLYIFNTFLFLLSAIVFVFLLLDLYRDNPKRGIIALIGIIVYVMEPELLHGMGIVYWHQSIMQVTLLLQFYSYYKYKSTSEKWPGCVFLILCLLNPYIEWTGYIANVGFAAAELITGRKEIGKALLKVLTIAGVTLISFGFFCTHYLLNVNAVKFFVALRNRFFARNFTRGIPVSKLLWGYVRSFQFSWLLLILLLIAVAIVLRKHVPKIKLPPPRMN